MRVWGGGTYRFQSHAGSIEAAKFEIPEIGEEMFQSHAGSIEAACTY